MLIDDLRLERIPRLEINPYQENAKDRALEIINKNKESLIEAKVVYKNDESTIEKIIFIAGIPIFPENYTRYKQKITKSDIHCLVYAELGSVRKNNFSKIYSISLDKIIDLFITKI